MSDLRRLWEPPRTPETLDAAVLHAYRREIVRPRRLRRLWFPAAAAARVVASVGIFAGARIERALHPPKREIYVPVRQPRIVVISEGDQQ
jgi:hypothetical protein